MGEHVDVLPQLGAARRRGAAARTVVAAADAGALPQPAGRRTRSLPDGACGLSSSGNWARHPGRRSGRWSGRSSPRIRPWTSLPGGRRPIARPPGRAPSRPAGTSPGYVPTRAWPPTRWWTRRSSTAGAAWSPDWWADWSTPGCSSCPAPAAPGSPRSCVPGWFPRSSVGPSPGARQWRPVIVTPGSSPVDALAELTGDYPARGAGPPGRRPVRAGVGARYQLGRADRVPRHRARPPRRRRRRALRRRRPWRPRRIGWPTMPRSPSGSAPHSSSSRLSPPPSCGRSSAEPARSVGLEVEDALVDAVVADGLGRPGALPLLSTALVGTWERRRWRPARSGRVHRGRRCVRRPGAVRGGRVLRARRSRARAGPAAAPAARRRRRRRGADPPAGAAGRARPGRRRGWWTGRVVEAFVRRRLLSVDRDRLEVAHEALLTAWPRLARWLDDDAAGRAVRRHLAPDGPRVERARPSGRRSLPRCPPHRRPGVGGRPGRGRDPPGTVLPGCVSCARRRGTRGGAPPGRPGGGGGTTRPAQGGGSGRRAGARTGRRGPRRAGRARDRADSPAGRGRPTGRAVRHRRRTRPLAAPCGRGLPPRRHR